MSQHLNRVEQTGQCPIKQGQCPRQSEGQCPTKQGWCPRLQGREVPHKASSSAPRPSCFPFPNLLQLDPALKNKIRFWYKWKYLEKVSDEVSASHTFLISECIPHLPYGPTNLPMLKLLMEMMNMYNVHLNKKEHVFLREGAC